MKGNLKKSSVLIVLAVLLAFIGTANAQGPMRKGKAADKAWSALDNVERLKGTLDKGGFAWQEGSVEYMDWVKDTCEGKMRDTAYNNPWPQAYATFKLPVHEGVGKPLADWAWQLREDEAVVLVGQTPPAAAYFSYQTILAFLPISPWPPPQDYRPQRIGPVVGDTINIATVNTIGPDRVNRPIVYIITGHRETERRVRMALLAAGYPAAIINVETIAPALRVCGKITSQIAGDRV